MDQAAATLNAPINRDLVFTDVLLATISAASARALPTRAR
jgi:hypothetical protein